MQLWWMLTHQAPPEREKSNDKPLQPQRTMMRFREHFQPHGVTSQRESASQCDIRTDWNLPDK